MSGFKAQEYGVGDQVPEDMYLPETMDQALSMIADYTRTYGLTPAEVCRIVNAGIGALAHAPGDTTTPAAPGAVWIGSGDA